ncbi:MAG: cytochrome c [Myxococcota bacterium]
MSTASRALAVVGLLATGCRLDMHDTPRFEALEYSTLWEDGRASRDPVEGTVARGQLREERPDYYTAQGLDGQLLETLPAGMTLDEELLQRGRTRYNVFCSPCHGYTGYGNGMVVQRGFKPPPSFHAERLKQSPIGYFYVVITNGYGSMYTYAPSIPPEDRWAIGAYVKALQLSQDMPVTALDAEQRGLIGQGPQAGHGDGSEYGYGYEATGHPGYGRPGYGEPGADERLGSSHGGHGGDGHEVGGHGEDHGAGEHGGEHHE